MSIRRGSDGVQWLASSAPDAQQILAAWERGELAAVRSGGEWDVVEAALMPSMRAMEALSRPRGLGPVLAYPEADRAWWLVPPNAEAHLADLPLLTVHPPGWLLRCPSPDRYAHGRGWLEKPDGSGTLTDPVALGAAFGRGGRLPAGAFG